MDRVVRYLVHGMTFNGIIYIFKWKGVSGASLAPFLSRDIDVICDLPQAEAHWHQLTYETVLKSPQDLLSVLWERMGENHLPAPLMQQTWRVLDLGHIR